MPNSQSCFTLSIYGGTGGDGGGEGQSPYQLSVHGGLEQSANRTLRLRFGSDVVCYNFNTTLPDVSEVSSLTLVVESAGSNVITYSPLINVCSCPSNGRCIQPSNTEFHPRNGTVLVLECACDSLPGILHQHSCIVSRVHAILFVGLYSWVVVSIMNCQ